MLEVPFSFSSNNTLNEYELTTFVQEDNINNEDDVLLLIKNSSPEEIKNIFQKFKNFCMQQHDIAKQDTENKDAAVQPDPETLHKTDPQDNMKGPVSSLMQGIKEDFEEGDKEQPEDPEEKLERDWKEVDEEEKKRDREKGHALDGSE